MRRALRAPRKCGGRRDLFPLIGALRDRLVGLGARYDARRLPTSGLSMLARTVPLATRSPIDTTIQRPARPRGPTIATRSPFNCNSAGVDSTSFTDRASTTITAIAARLRAASDNRTTGVSSCLSAGVDPRAGPGALASGEVLAVEGFAPAAERQPGEQDRGDDQRMCGPRRCRESWRTHQNVPAASRSSVAAKATLSWASSVSRRAVKP